MAINLEDLVFGNAAGTVKSLPDVARMCRSAATRITVGSITLQPREGNQGETYYFDPDTKASINALGLPNMGIKKFAEALPAMLETAHAYDKKLWVSVAGFKPTDFAELALACIQAGVDGIELNLGCPNLHDGGKQKAIFSYNAGMVYEVIDCVGDALSDYGHFGRVGIKISPVPEEKLMQLITTIESSYVSEVIAVNTEPNQTMEKPDRSQALSFLPPDNAERKHVGGLAGEPLRESGLRVVKALKEGLSGTTRVIAAGGIFTGAHAKAYLDAGADGFECATAYLEHGPKIFADIMRDLIEL